MNDEKVPYRQLPRAIKIALWLLGVHVILYVKAVAEAIFVLGFQMHPIWILHIFVSVFLLSEIARPRKGMYFSVAAYSLALPTVMLKNNLAPVWGTPVVSTVLLSSLLYCVPLYLVAPFVIAQRSFYSRTGAISTVPHSSE